MHIPIRSKNRRGIRRDNDGAEIANVDVELSTADDDMRVNIQLDSLAAVLVYRTSTSRDLACNAAAHRTEDERLLPPIREPTAQK